MIKDLVYSNVKTFGELTEDYEFQTIDDMAFLRKDMFPLGFLNPIEPTQNCYSMGKSSGMIAISRENYGIGASHPYIEYYDARSEKLGGISMKSNGNLAFVHVLPTDEIIAVSDSGTVSRISYGVETVISTLNLPNLLINAAAFYDGGVVVSTSDGNIIDIENYDKPNIVQHFDNIARPRCMTAIPPSKSNTESIIIMFLDNGHLFVIDDRRYYEMKLSKYVLAIAPSYSYSKIAILLEDFTIIVANQALDKIYYQTQIDLNDMEDFQMMTWIGDIVPALSFNGAVILGTEDPSSPVFFVDGSPYLFMECDSIYSITQTESFRIVAVPNNVFKVLNKYLVERSDGVKLCEIFDNRLTEPFVEKLSAINDVPSAINDIISTAEFVTDKASQAYFVAVACFVNSYSNKGRGTMIGEVCRKLRVANCMLEYGVPITSKQLDEIDSTTILQRLCKRKQFEVAYNLAKFLNVPEQVVSDEQVKYTVKFNSDDGSVIGSLPLDKIRPSFAAEYSWQIGRPNLGIMFAELETDYSKKAILLAKMDQWDKAINAAADTCDSSSLLSVLSLSLEKGNEEIVNTAIANCEPAVRVLMRLPRMTTPVRLGVILDKIPPTIPAMDAVRTYKTVQSQFTSGLECANTLKKLKDMQNELAARSGDQSIVGKSLNETLRSFFKKGDEDGAYQFGKKLGMDEKRVDALLFAYYVKTKDMYALKRFGMKKSRKEMWPQITMILKRENTNLAREFIDSIASIDPKMKMSMQQDFENGKFAPRDIESMKPLSCIFNS